MVLALTAEESVGGGVLDPDCVAVALGIDSIVPETVMLTVVEGLSVVEQEEDGLSLPVCEGVGDVVEDTVLGRLPEAELDGAWLPVPLPVPVGEPAGVAGGDTVLVSVPEALRVQVPLGVADGVPAAVDDMVLERLPEAELDGVWLPVPLPVPVGELAGVAGGGAVLVSVPEALRVPVPLGVADGVPVAVEDTVLGKLPEAELDGVWLPVPLPVPVGELAGVAGGDAVLVSVPEALGLAGSAPVCVPVREGVALAEVVVVSLPEGVGAAPGGVALALRVCVGLTLGVLLRVGVFEAVAALSPKIAKLSSRRVPVAPSVPVEEPMIRMEQLATLLHAAGRGPRGPDKRYQPAVLDVVTAGRPDAINVPVGPVVEY